MMKILFSLIQKIWWIGAIFALVFTLAVTNHIPNTILSGWDTLHPEFDLADYTSRVMNGAWQQHQGLGAPPSQAHAAEIVRLPILWLMGLILPMNLIRYSFLFTMIFVGGVGVATFINSLKMGDAEGRMPGFLAAVFYILSLISVQQFYVPLEMFAVHYAVVPWLMMTLYYAMVKSNPKWSGGFVLLSIIGAPQAHTATLYYILVGLMGIFVLCIALISRSIAYFRKGMVALLLGLIVNLYWIGPNLYYLVTRGEQVSASKIHSEFTPEAVLQNQAYGEVKDIVIGRNFLFNWFDYSFKDQKFNLLLDEWHQHFDSPMVLEIMYGFGVIAILGLATLAIGKKQYRAFGWSGLALLTIAVFFLINNNPPTHFVFNFIMEQFPIVAEGLRFPFTKFSIFYLFLMSMGFGVFFMFLFRFLQWRFLQIGLGIAILGCFGYLYRPAFTGGYVSQNMQVEIPTDYFKLFDYMKTQPQSDRVALMPVPNYWGWTYNDWTESGYKNGYQGAGFLWFGIRQPLLNREFDRWSIYNENFYNEFATSLYMNEPHSLEAILSKYDARYVLLDESVIAPGQGKVILRIEETKKLASELGWEQKFQEGFLTVWEVKSQSSDHSPTIPQGSELGSGEQGISAPSTYVLANGDTVKTREDVVYKDVETYVEGESGIIYPFAGLMREEVRGVEYGEVKIKISYEETPPASGVPTLPSATSPVEESPQIIIPGWKVGDIVRINYRDGQPLPAYTVNGQPGPQFLGIEKPEEGKSYIVARVNEGEEWAEYLGDKEFNITGNRIIVEVTGEPFVYDFGKVGAGTTGNCDVLSRGSAVKEGSTYFADERGAVCDYVVMPEIDTRLSYLMRLQGESMEGRSVKFFLYNTGSKRNDIEYLLGKSIYDQTFSLLPWTWDGYYTLNIETRSFGQYAENTLQPVEVRWFPLEQIARARIIGYNGETPPASGVPARDSLGSPVEEFPQLRSDLLVTGVKKYGTWLYIVDTKNGGLLKLSQGYDEGWVSPYLEHVKVDGWANGWIVPAGEHQILIFYWPQLLEYFGFGLLGITVWFVIKSKSDKN